MVVTALLAHCKIIGSPLYMRLYLDQTTVATIPNTAWNAWYTSNGDSAWAPFDQAFYPILNLAVGG
jgi:hypothetical protein